MLLRLLLVDLSACDGILLQLRLENVSHVCPDILRHWAPQPR